MDYNILIPPIDKPFERFSKEEAEKYFKWHMEQIPGRIQHLQEYSGILLNYSAESLVDIWGWFLKNAKIEKTPQKRLDELKREAKHLPSDMVKIIIKENKFQFSLITEYIMRDIAMYFGEVCVKNNLSISWGFHTNTKKDSFANQPILVGFEDRDFTPPFKAEFEPVFTVRNIASNIFDGDATKRDLLKIYQKWLRMVFNEE